MQVDRNGLEVLPRDECVRLLAKPAIGRLALTVRALPTMVPVSFCVHNDRIFVRTGGSADLRAGLRDAVVAFEVDDIDPVDQTGWHVVVTGRAREITNAEELELVALSPFTAWAPAGDGGVAAIEIELVSGRRNSGGRFR